MTVIKMRQSRKNPKSATTHKKQWFCKKQQARRKGVLLAHATTPSSASPVSISQQQQSLRHERILHMRKEAFRQLRIQLEYEQMVLFEQLKHLEGRGWSPSSSPSSSSLEDKESVFASAMVAAERVDAGSTADDLTQLLKHVDISENQLLLEFEQQTQREQSLTSPCLSAIGDIF